MLLNKVGLHGRWVRDAERVERAFPRLNRNVCPRLAGLVLLEASPLQDIRNIRRQAQAIARGRIMDGKSLPRKRLFYTGGE